MKRMCYIVFSYYPADPRVRREAEVLERAGIDVDVICLRNEGELPFEKIGSVSVHRVLSGADNKENMGRYLFLTALFGLVAFFKAVLLAPRRNYGIVQVHNMPDYLVFAGILHRLAGRPVVLDLHDLSPELFESKWGGTGRRILLPLVRLVEKAACLFANRLITTSEGFRKRLVERGVPPEKITLVLNSANERIFTPGRERSFEAITEGARLLYHGTVARRFGLHVAVEAVRRLQERIPGTRLTIYGKYDPSYRNELAAQIARLGLDDLVRLEGFLMMDDVPRAIEDADIGVVPYLSDPFMDLALSTKTFEYVSMGLPIVASRVPSLTSTFEDGCIHYCESGDAGSLADRIAACCLDGKARRRACSLAREAYRRFSWDKMETRYLGLVGELLGPSG